MYWQNRGSRATCINTIAAVSTDLLVIFRVALANLGRCGEMAVKDSGAYDILQSWETSKYRICGLILQKSGRCLTLLQLRITDWEHVFVNSPLVN